MTEYLVYRGGLKIDKITAWNCAVIGGVLIFYRDYHNNITAAYKEWLYFREVAETEGA